MKLFPAFIAAAGLLVFTDAQAAAAPTQARPAAAPEAAPVLTLDTRLTTNAEQVDAAIIRTTVEAPLSSAINPEFADDHPKERIYDGLLPGDDYTITMDAFPDQNGSNECVQLIKALLGAPRTFFWKEGRKIKDNIQAIKPGTAIATFVRGQYPQRGRTGMHAAIFVRANKAGIYVLDQFRSKGAVTERFIPWHNGSKKRSNNASAYSTIVW